MPTGTRLTVGHYAGGVQKARKKLHEALRVEGLQLPQQIKQPLEDANKALAEYMDAKRREEKSKEKRDSLI